MKMYVYIYIYSEVPVGRSAHAAGTDKIPHRGLHKPWSSCDKNF